MTVHLLDIDESRSFPMIEGHCPFFLRAGNVKGKKNCVTSRTRKDEQRNQYRQFVNRSFGIKSLGMMVTCWCQITVLDRSHFRPESRMRRAASVASAFIELIVAWRPRITGAWFESCCFGPVAEMTKQKAREEARLFLATIDPPTLQPESAVTLVQFVEKL